LFDRIVVGTDGSPTATRAVERAILLASVTGAVVHLASAHRPIEIHVGSAHEAGSHGRGDGRPIVCTDVDVEAALAQAAAASAAAGVKTEVHAVQGDAATAILSVADKVLADLIVVGSVGVERRVFGSVPRNVAQRARCDVLIVHTT